MSDLTPPDMKQCQAYPNVAKHSPFSLGPRPTPIRCEEFPVWLVAETVPGSDGKCGSMTVCQSCADLMPKGWKKSKGIKVTPIKPAAIKDAQEERSDA